MNGPALNAAATTELVACAWDLVHAAERMRMHWAEVSDGARNRTLWVPLHAAADVLRERLELVTCPVCGRLAGAGQECPGCFVRADVAYERSQDR